jgi:hypothetical protein
MNRWLAILAPVTTFGMLSGGRKPAAAPAPHLAFTPGNRSIKSNVPRNSVRPVSRVATGITPIKP